MERIREFLVGVKKGNYRGNYRRERIKDNVVLEVSVGSFQNGKVMIRVLVDDGRIQQTDGLYFRQLYRVDKEYSRIHTNIANLINSEDETDIENRHEWSISDTDESQSLEEHGWLPESFEADTTSVFNDSVQIRDDVTIRESIRTNRR